MKSHRLRVAPPPAKPAGRRIPHPHRAGHKSHAPKRHAEPQTRAILLNDPLPLVRVDGLHHRTTKRQTDAGPDLKRRVDHAATETLDARGHALQQDDRARAVDDCDGGDDEEGCGEDVGEEVGGGGGEERGGDR